MFVGFTPWVPGTREPYVNPKYAKIFKLVGAGFPGSGKEIAQLEGRSIIDGFKRLGYAAVGTGAVGWFDPASPTGQLLSADFDEFSYSDGAALRDQLAFVDGQLGRLDGRPVFPVPQRRRKARPLPLRGRAMGRRPQPVPPLRRRQRRRGVPPPASPPRVRRP